MKILMAVNTFKDFDLGKNIGRSIIKGLGMPATNMPVADGGDGTIHAIESSKKCRTFRKRVTGPLYSMRVNARYITYKKTAIIEMNSAGGLHLLPLNKRNPLKTTTFGFGELINDAIIQGAKKLILCIGGSATVDCGIGMMSALGAKFFSNDSEIIKPAGADLSRITAIIMPKIRAEMIIASDVSSNFTHIMDFTDQKTYRNKKRVKNELSRGLKHFSSIVDRKDLEITRGSGAAGGLGYGLLLLGAQIKPGFDIVSDIIGLQKKIKSHDIIVTGEGCFDKQTFEGKAPIGVAKLARKYKKRCILVAGRTVMKTSRYFTIIAPGKHLTIAQIKRTGHQDMIDAGREIRSIL